MKHILVFLILMPAIGINASYINKQQQIACVGKNESDMCFLQGGAILQGTPDCPTCTEYVQDYWGNCTDGVCTKK